MNNQPEIDPLWVSAMIACGGIGVIAHILVTVRTFPLMFGNQVTQNGKILIFGCILVYIFNGIACLIWLLFRTNILISLSITSCKFIYVANFLCYFVAKYILHLILISRTYLAFIGTLYRIKLKIIVIYVVIVSLHFFATVVLWTIEVFPHVLQGTWVEYSICTLFSDDAQNALTVKLCAILVGVEDFVVGIITLYIILKRFIKLSRDSTDVNLVKKTIRYGIVACIAMISTLFLFTLAVPFWPNITFIIAIDATISSFCVFCVLSIGSKAYKILCYPFIWCENRFIENEVNDLKIIIHSERPTFPSTTTTTAITTKGEITLTEFQRHSIAKEKQMEKIMEKSNHRRIQLQRHYSEPLNVENMKRDMLKKQFNAVSNPIVSIK